MAANKNIPNVTVLDEGPDLLLANRFRPLFDQRLPHLSRPDAEAVAVADELGNEELFFCLLCGPEAYIRHDTLLELAERTPRRIRLPHAAGAVRRKDGKHVYAIIFDQAKARPLSQFYGDKPVPEKDLTLKILPSIVTCLTDMNQRSLCHREIRPDTILVGAEGEVILDQCVIGLPGESQPFVYEPLQTCMSTPGARGAGSPTDDVYALGVTALSLAVGHLQSDRLTREEVVNGKIQQGTYQFLLRRRKFSSALQSFFAGTLADRSRQRWTLEDLKAWAGGHWDMPRPSSGSPRAARPIQFKGRDIFCPDLLAWAFHDAPEDAATAILNQRTEKWIRNVVEDNQAADAVANARRIHELASVTENVDIHETVARACLALDPRGPMRFRSLVLSPSGLAGAIWHSFISNDQTMQDDLGRLLSSPLLVDWQGTGTRRVRTALPAFVTNTIKTIMVERGKPGFGLERLLYETLPWAPCLAESVRQSIARTPADLLLALDRLSATDPKKCLEIDKHMAGFILAKDKSAEGPVRSLSFPHPTESEALTARADLLAYTQRNFFPPPLVNLSLAIGAAVRPTMDVIQSRVRRMVIVQKIEAQSKTGDISALIRDLNLAQTLKQDKEEFKGARERLETIERLIEIASSNGRAQAILAQKRGYRYAKLFSMSVSFLTVFYFSMVELL